MKSAGKCWKCGCEISLPDELYDAAKRSENISFWCAYGHGAHFPQGDTEADKLRRERDRLKQDAARLEDEIKYQRELRQAAERQTSAAKGIATRLRNRASAGLCPCCNRSFENMQRHMKTQHPEFKTAEIIPIERAS